MIEDRIFIIFMFAILIYIAFLNMSENKKLLKELKDLNSTLEYIDKRMDTLEFYRVPEQYKR